MDSMTFHLDCGEAVGGRRITATGLRVDGMSDDAIHADYSEHAEGRPVYAMVALTYRITPALAQDGNRRDICATVRLDPPADPAYWDEVLAPGAEAETTSEATEAAVGPFVLPDGTRTLTVHLVEATLTTVDEARADRQGAASSEPERDLGNIVVDLVARTPQWEPAEPRA